MSQRDTSDVEAGRAVILSPMGGENRCEAQGPCGHLTIHLSLHGNGVVSDEGAISSQPLQERGHDQILHHNGSAGECEGAPSSGQCCGGQSDVGRGQVYKGTNSTQVDTDITATSPATGSMYVTGGLMSGSTDEVLSTGRKIDVQVYTVPSCEGNSTLICASPWKVLALDCETPLVTSSWPS